MIGRTLRMERAPRKFSPGGEILGEAPPFLVWLWSEQLSDLLAKSRGPGTTDIQRLI